MSNNVKAVVLNVSVIDDRSNYNSIHLFNLCASAFPPVFIRILSLANEIVLQRTVHYLKH